MKTGGVYSVLLALLPAVATAAGDDYSPSVSRSESRIMQQAAEIAATNRPAAAAMLQEAAGPDSSAALDFTIGNYLYRSGELDAAAGSFRDALEKMPRFRAARMNLARVLMMGEHWEQAAGALRPMAAEGWGTGESFLLLGHALFEQGLALEAETAYRQALMLAGGRDARLGLARSLLRQERYRPAVRLLAELLEDDPGDGATWLLRVQALIAQDRFKDALVAGETARRLGAADHHLLATLGDLYLDSAQPDEALARYEEAFAGSLADPRRLLRAAEWLLGAGREDDAAGLLDRARDAERAGEWPPSDLLRMLRLEAELAAVHGDHDRAEEGYREILRRDPSDGRTLMLLGALQQRRGKMEEALMTYERAARVDGFEARALVGKAQIAVERSRYERAVDLLESAQAFDQQPHVEQYLRQVRRLADTAGRR